MTETSFSERKGPSTLRDDLRRGTKAYDVMTAVPLVVLYGLGAIGQLGALREKLGQFDLARPNLTLSLLVLSQVAIFLFALLIIGLLFARTPPRASARGIAPRVIAVLGTCLMLTLLILPRRELSGAALSISTALVLGGTAFATYALSFLGRSISVMAEARRLVTGGPYSLVRHPLYLGEQIAAIGAMIQFFSIWAVAILALQICCQLYRMRCEEHVLAESFPEYADYKVRTWRILPGIY